MKNIAAFTFLLVITLSCAKDKSDSCINLKAVNNAIVCTDDYNPVCGCDGITYGNACYARNFYGVMFYTPGECNPQCEEIIKGDWERGPEFMDQVQINEAEVRGDCIWINFSYGGGCGEHDFRLSLRPLFCGTPPVPPAHLMLEHQGNGDLCQALLTEEMEFDLTSLRKTDPTETRILLTDPAFNYSKEFVYKY